MKRSIAFFVVTVLVSLPVTKVYAYWNDKLNVDFTAMFVYPTQIVVEKSGDVTGSGASSEQKQFNQQTPAIEGDGLLNPDKDKAPVQNFQSDPVVEEQHVDMEQEAINHYTVSEVSES